MDRSAYDWVVVGGGIVGLGTALALQRRFPGARLAVLEKEDGPGRHQTGHNSGVLHSGLYYRPGSLKARLCVQGNREMLEFCRAQGLPHEVCGKLVVATAEEEIPRLEELARRGEANGVPLRRISPAEARELEPHVRCLAALRVESTGIVDFKAVARRMAELVQGSGGEFHPGTRVEALRPGPEGTVLVTPRGTFRTREVVNCGGLHSDRLARAAGAPVRARIVPFRGEYWELVPERRHLVRGLVYPVPNPAFPFLGVHFTRMIDGSVHVGPNAVLAFHREGYRWTDVSPRDLLEVLAFPGFWRLAGRYLDEGLREMARSLLKSRFVASARCMIPDVRSEDLVPAGAGVRAQALMPDGALVDDFLIERQPGALHVLNAPSPAATASLAIGAVVAERASA